MISRVPRTTSGPKSNHGSELRDARSGAGPGRLRSSNRTTRILPLSLALAYFVLAPIPQLRLVRVGSVSITAVIGMLACAVSALRALRSRKSTIGSTREFGIPVALLAIASAIGLARAPAAGFESSAYNLALGVIPAVLVALARRDNSEIRAYAVAWLSGITMAAIVWIYNETTRGLTGTFEGESLSMLVIHERDWELAASMGIQNVYGCMAMGAAAAASFTAMLGAQKRRGRLLFGAAAVILFVGQSRGGYMVSTLIAIAGSCVGVVLGGNGTRSLRRFALPMSGAAVLALAGSEFLDLTRTMSRLDEIKAGGLGADQSIFERMESIGKSLTAIAENPVLGIGYQGWVFDVEWRISMHSSLVDIPAQLGILGFLGYYGCCVWPGIRVLRSARRTPPGSACRVDASVAIVALFAYALGSVLNSVFPQPFTNETLFIGMGLAIAASTRCQRTEAEVRPAPGANLAPI